MCVEDAVGQFNALKHHGEVLGIHKGSYRHGVSVTNHWQGIARLPADGGRRMVVSRSGRADLVVATLGSRDVGGGRLRSNKLARGKNTDKTRPPANDRFVMSAHDSNYGHAGGIQAVGNVVAASFDQPTKSHVDEGKIAFFDLGGRRGRRLGYEISRDEAAGAVGMSQLHDGRYLVVVGGFHSNRSLDFYVSEGTDIENLEFDRKARWSVLTGDMPRSTIGDTHWPRDLANIQGYQALNLITQCDGQLFMIGTHRTTPFSPGARDYADLWKLEGRTGRVLLTKVAKKHMYCNWSKSGQACDLAASGGAYVDPRGELMLYGTTHTNKGTGGSLPVGEYRHRDGNRLGQCGRGEGWVELYDDDGFRDRSLVFDYRDRDREDLRRFKSHDGFNDKASSARWCLPAGCVATLHADTGHKGRTLRLTGKGSISNLKSRNFGDETSSIAFSGTCH